MMKDSFKKALGKINNPWIRFAVFIIVGINTGAMLLGFELLPFSNEQMVGGLSVIAMVISEIWNHYKNNSYTREAKLADINMKSMKIKKKNRKKGGKK